MGASLSTDVEHRRRIDDEIERVRHNLESIRIGIDRQIRQHQEHEARRQNRIQWEFADESIREVEARKIKQSEKENSKKQFQNRLIKQKVTKNPDFLNELRRVFNLESELEPLNHYPTSAYHEKELRTSSSAYERVSNMFLSSNRSFFTISKIVEVKNPFLILQYHLMKDKHSKKEHVQETILFHGTKIEHLDNICTYNFDRSKVKTHKFGHGVSFAKDAFYASHYHLDNKRKLDKVMIVVQMLYGEIQIGGTNTIVPGAPCYTTTNQNGSVYVKYDDASVYPKYIVYYRGLHPPKSSSRRGLRYQP